MAWIGKAVGGVLGLAVGGPIGSALGVLLGHQFDLGVAQLSTGDGVLFGSDRIQQLFFETTFAVMGHIAKADGRVSQSEIRAARRIMHGMNLSPGQVKTAIDHFTAGKSTGYPVSEKLTQLNNHLSKRTDLVRAFVEIQMQALIAAGSIEMAKRELLWQVARGLGMGRVELAQIEALVRAQQFRVQSGGKESISMEQAYRVLGLDPDVSDKEVKTAYRRLMNQHHPDKLVARGLPESMTSVAEEKTHEIRAAYERIKTQRAFK
ncbi:MAG: co-chaperone DjlA [Pseudomonadota bacterium]|nr:co-chaperone DjlA [Pseudomonadota bacterium]